jgi:hypothetical protein
MDLITRLIHDDMFLAVVSYLSIGLIFLAYFYFREKKWEADLSKYEINPVFPGDATLPAYHPGSVSVNRDNGKIVAVVGLNQEAQIVPERQTERATAMAIAEAIAITEKPVTSAIILPFRAPQRNPAASSQHRRL